MSIFLRNIIHDPTVDGVNLLTIKENISRAPTSSFCPIVSRRLPKLRL